MATFSGHLLPPIYDHVEALYTVSSVYPVGWDLGWDQLWNGAGISQLWNAAVDADVPVLYGSATDRQPYYTTRRNITGYYAGAFSDIFYNRIVIEPLFIDFGALTGNSQKDFTVWNAFFIDSVLQSIQQNNFDSDLEFSGEITPRTFKPLEEETYTIDTSIDGPAIIDASLDFEFTTPIATIVVSITGTRIVFLPIIYKPGMEENLEWVTDIMSSYNGTEQRVMNRIHPRQLLTVKGFVNKDETINIENLLYGWRDKYWAIPIWQEARAGSSIVAGSSTINVDTRYGDFRADSLAGIWTDQNTFDIATIISLTDSTISFDRSINDNFSAPIIFPVRLARMSESPVRTTTGYNAILGASLQVTDNISLTPGTYDQYLDEDVFLDVPESGTGSTFSDKYETRVDLIDYDTGAVAQITPWTNLRINRSFTIVKEGLEEIWEFRLWLHRRAGRLRPFWMPTFEENMKILTTGFISDLFYIVPESYAQHASARENIIIFLKDGTHLIRKILTTNTDDSEQTRIGTDSALNVYAEDIDYVSFIGLKRLASDKLSVMWYQNNVAVFTVPIKEIQP